MTSMLSAKHSLRVEADEAHRGREVYYQVTDPAYAGVGGATLETRHLKRLRVAVPATPSTNHCSIWREVVYSRSVCPRRLALALLEGLDSHTSNHLQCLQAQLE